MTSTGTRGLVVVAPAIDLGLKLAACERLAGFDSVLRRAKEGERSALSELTFAAQLVTAGFNPVLEPILNGKVLDTCVSVRGEVVYCEVIAPETSAAMQEARRSLNDLAIMIAKSNRGKRVEVLLKTDITPEIIASVVMAVEHLPMSGEIVEVGGVALASVRSTTESSDIGPTIPGPEGIAVLGFSKGIEDVDIRSVVVVRLPIGDERAKRLLYGESHHFSSEHMNILVMDVTRVPGGIEDWEKLIGRCLQPSQNRRLGAVVLFSEGLLGIDLAIERMWRIIQNPYAYRPIPAEMLDVIGSVTM
jgi:hypothetical protein